MNRQQFISYIQEPEILSDDSAAFLESLVKEYPFFQTAHLLYAKNLSNQNSIQYNNQLKVAAAYSGDRKVLYNLISKNKPAELKVVERKPVFVEPVTETLVIPVVQPDVKQEKLIENIEQKVGKLLDEKIEILSFKLEANAKVIEQRLSEVEHKTEEVKPVVAEIKPPKDIQLVYSIEKGFEGGLKPPVDASEISDLTKDAINEAIDASVEMQMSQLMYEEKKKKQQEAIKIEHEKGLDKNAVQPFSVWLKSTKRFETKKEATRQQVFDMIDEFTRKQETEGVRPRVEFFSPENMAKKSVELDESIITETLAKILVKQKEYSKAIRAYEMLSLKYPEKSVFFATQILEIKKLKST
jgi:hypothetical protein